MVAFLKLLFAEVMEIFALFHGIFSNQTVTCMFLAILFFEGIAFSLFFYRNILVEKYRKETKGQLEYVQWENLKKLWSFAIVNYFIGVALICSFFIFTLIKEFKWW